MAAAEMFWGLWLLPLAVLVWRSGFMPRFIGAWLVLNGVLVGAKERHRSGAGSCGRYDSEKSGVER